MMTIVGLVAFVVGLALGAWAQWSFSVEAIAVLRQRLSECERRLVQKG
jgi:hypothetical protein